MKYKVDTSPSRNELGAVIVCAGKGERTGLSYNKVLHRIGIKTVLETTLDVFYDVTTNITVVAADCDMSKIGEIISAYKGVSLVAGGATRFDSVKAGLAATPCDTVIIHDGARPYVTRDIITRSIESAVLFGSGIAAVPCVDTVKRRTPDNAVTGLPREELFSVQTPQTFRYSEIRAAYDHAESDRIFTDDAEVYENAGFRPHLIEGSYDNIKITTPRDLLPAMPQNGRIGIGYDVHRLTEGRPLILGGVHIPYERGLLGHSDADVLTHAVMDALLSAADLPDIGVLFPDTDDKYLGISSMKLLSEVIAKLDDLGYTVVNISAVIAAQKPKLSPIIYEIRKSLASALAKPVECVNVSATTTEGLGIVGSGDAIAASASCIISGERK